MIGYILTSILLVFLILKFYKNRIAFKKLKGKEWLQFIGGFVCAWAIAVIIIIGGMYFKEYIQNEWLRKGIALILILIGLRLAGFIMQKTFPKKLEKFFS